MSNEWILVQTIVSNWKADSYGNLHSGFRPVTEVYIKQDIETNTTTFHLKMYGEVLDTYRKIVSTSYSFRINFNSYIQDFNGSTSLSGISTGMRVLVGELEKEIKNNDDGTSPQIVLQNGGSCNLGYLAGTDAEQTVYTYVSSLIYFTAPKIPRGSIISSIINTNDNKSNIPVNINTEIKVNYNKFIADTYDKLVLKMDSTVITTKTGISNPCIFNLTSAEVLTIQNLMVEDNSKALTFELSAYKENTFENQIGIISSLNIDALITNANPTITSCDFEDTNQITLALTGNSKYIIKGYSNIKFSNLVANALQQAILENVNINGNIYNYASNFEKTINNYTQSNAKIFVIDSRSNPSNEYSMTFSTFVDYFNIIKNESDYERTGYTDECIFSFAGQFFNSNFGAVNNELSVSYRYKDLGDTTDDNWVAGTSEINPTVSNNNFTFNGALKGDTDAGFSVGTSFKVEIIVSDKLSSITYSFDVIAGIPAIDIFKSYVALGGNYDEALGGSIQMYTDNGNIYVDGVLFIEHIEE